MSANMSLLELLTRELYYELTDEARDVGASLSANLQAPWPDFQYRLVMMEAVERAVTPLLVGALQELVKDVADLEGRIHRLLHHEEE